MLKIFVLEDEIDRLPRCAILPALEGHEVTVAKSFQEAKEKYYSQTSGYDLLLLDHDMEGFYEYNPEYPNTGLQFVKWLTNPGPMFDGDSSIHRKECICYEDPDGSRGECDFCMTKPHVVIHSHNPQGRRLMRLLLEDYGFVVEEYPFNSEYVKQLKQVLKDRDSI